MHQLNKQDILPHVLVSIVSIVCIVILVAPAAALSITNGALITTPGGATSPVITITDFPFAQNDTLTIDLSDMKWFLVNFSFNNDNVMIHSNASSAVWTKTLSTDGNTLTLTSSNGPTAINETVTVTFRGTAGNPWGDSDWLKSIPVKVTRTGNHTDDFFTFDINTTIPQQGLHINDGATITTPNGSTSPVITITDSPIAQNGSITIDVSYLRLLVASNTFTDANVMISSKASFAVWTKSVSADGNTLTLTSTHGPTQMNETITVTLTGAGGNPWLARSGPQNPVLTATRSDGKGVRDFTFRIETVPISDPVADFTASPTLDIAPLTILFTDSSPGSPISWNWNFGDGETSTSQNPSHTYTKAGTYTVSLIATYAPEGEKTKTRTNYITVLNGAIRQANTSVTGLTLTNCGGMQTITIDTSVLPAVLSPNNSVLEIQPPADRGLKNITLSALNGVGFSRNGNLIVGNLTGVHLVSEDIRPPHGFSDTTGSLSSFNYSIDLSSYPCNAVLSTKIWEGVIPLYDTKFRQIASGNQPPAFPVGTAYTAKITRTNFPSSAPVKIHMSVNSSWNGLLGGGPGTIFIWRIADDENSGQILPTDYRYSDVIHNLDFYEADSPQGMSTFGISSLTGSNNPFQLVIFTIQQAVSAPDSSPGSGDAYNGASNTGAGAGKATGPVTVQTANPQKAPSMVDPGKTEKIYTNAQGVITQATLLESTDQLARISFDKGVVAKDRTGAPLTSVSITSVTAERLPSPSTSAGSAFTGMAYTVEPDGASFSPAVPFSLLYPQAQWAEEYFVKTFDTQSGSWVDIPTIHDAGTGRITANVSHFCTIALFAQPIVSAHPSPPKSTPVQMLAPVATPPPPPGTALNIFIGMMTWVTGLVVNNVYIVVIVVVLGIAYYVKKRKSPGSGL